MDAGSAPRMIARVEAGSDGEARARIERSRFIEVAARHGLGAEAAANMWSELARGEISGGTQPDGAAVASAGSLRLPRVVAALLSLGCLLVIASSVWWATELEDDEAGLLLLSTSYGAAFLVAASYLRARGFALPAAIGATVAAFYVPAAVAAALLLLGFDFEQDDNDVLELHLWVDQGWIVLELTALAGAALLYRWFRAPLLVLPISLAALLLVLDGLTRLVGLEIGDEPNMLLFSVLVVGASLGVVAVAVVLDHRGLRRHALWPHVVGATGVLWGAMLVGDGDDSWKYGLLACGVVYLVLGVWLVRLGYLVAGALAIWIGATALAPSPVVVAVSGLGAIALAVWLSLAQSPLRRWLDSKPLPAAQRD